MMDTLLIAPPVKRTFGRTGWLSRISTDFDCSTANHGNQTAVMAQLLEVSVSHFQHQRRAGKKEWIVTRRFD